MKSSLKTFLHFRSSTGPDLKKGRLMQAVRKDISSGQVCYGGQTLTWSDKGQKKRKAETKKSILNAIVGSTLTSSSKENNENLSTNKKGMVIYAVIYCRNNANRQNKSLYSVNKHESSLILRPGRASSEFHVFTYLHC